MEQDLISNTGYVTQYDEEKAINIVVEFAHRKPGIRRLFGIRNYSIVSIECKQQICFTYFINDEYHYEIMVDISTNSVSGIYKVYYNFHDYEDILHTL